MLPEGSAELSLITAIHLLLRQLFMMIGQGNVNVTAFFAQLTIKTGSHTDGDYSGERQAGSCTRFGRWILRR